MILFQKKCTKYNFENAHFLHIRSNCSNITTYLHCFFILKIPDDKKKHLFPLVWQDNALNRMRRTKNVEMLETRRCNPAKLERNAFSYREREDLLESLGNTLGIVWHKGASKTIKPWIYQEVLHLLSIVGDSLIKAVLKSNLGALSPNHGKIFIHWCITIRVNLVQILE